MSLISAQISLSVVMPGIASLGGKKILSLCACAHLSSKLNICVCMCKTKEPGNSTESQGSPQLLCEVRNTCIRLYNFPLTCDFFYEKKITLLFRPFNSDLLLDDFIASSGNYRFTINSCHSQCE